MNHGSLFSGIGGFDLASEWMGWNNIFHCEIESFPQKILKHYWPNSISYEDIKKTDFTIHRGEIDVLTGGFPCQPYSQAGKRLGKEDERHLWPEMLRAIREIQPGYIVGENVYGLINWNGGLVFDEILSDLENEGYEVTPVILPACAKNAPHRRDRIWFVAYSTSTRGSRKDANEINRCDRNNTRKETKILHPKGKRNNKIKKTITNTNGSIFRKEAGQRWNNKIKGLRMDPRPRTNAKNGIVTDTNDKGMEGQVQKSGKIKQSIFEKTKPRDSINGGILNWQNFPTQSPVCSGDDGIFSRLDNITFPKWRNESIKAYGNAIVPQIAFEIFKVIDKLK